MNRAPATDRDFIEALRAWLGVPPLYGDGESLLTVEEIETRRFYRDPMREPNVGTHDAAGQARRGAPDR